MKSYTVSILKVLLSSVSTLIIILSAFMIYLIFDMWIHEGIPPFENLKFSIALFFTIILLLIMCQCLKFYTDIAMDSRNNSIR